MSISAPSSPLARRVTAALVSILTLTTSACANFTPLAPIGSGPSQKKAGANGYPAANYPTQPGAQGYPQNQYPQNQYPQNSYPQTGYPQGNNPQNPIQPPLGNPLFDSATPVPQTGLAPTPPAGMPNTLSGNPSADNHWQQPQGSISPSAFNNIWDRIRAGFRLDLTVNHKRVIKERTWYATHGDYLLQVFERARPYLYHIVSELEKRGLLEARQKSGFYVKPLTPD